MKKKLLLVLISIVLAAGAISISVSANGEPWWYSTTAENVLKVSVNSNYKTIQLKSGKKYKGTVTVTNKANKPISEACLYFDIVIGKYPNVARAYKAKEFRINGGETKKYSFTINDKDWFYFKKASSYKGKSGFIGAYVNIPMPEASERGWAYSKKIKIKCGTTVKSTTSSKKSLNKAKITLNKYSYTYSGKAKKPKVTVKLSGKILKKGTDYTVSYKKNTNAGIATATVTGKGKYKGSKNKNFTIKKAKTLSLSAVKTVRGTVEQRGKSIPLNIKTNKKTGLSYTSQHEGVAKASGGSVTIKGAGKTKITVSTTNNNYVKRTVTIDVYVGSVTVDDVVMCVGTTKKINVKSNFSNVAYSLSNTCPGTGIATGSAIASELSSVDSARIVSVDKSGNLTAKKAGIAFVAVKQQDTPASQTILVTVNSDDSWKNYHIAEIPGINSALVQFGVDSVKNLCPQGLCVTDNYILISAYDSKTTRPAVVYVLNKSGSYLGYFNLAENNSHVGGIAYDNRTGKVWVSRDDKLYVFDENIIPEAMRSHNLSVFTNPVTLNVNAAEINSSFLTYHNGYIWVGLFTKSGNTKVQAINTNPPYQAGVQLSVAGVTKAQGMSFVSDSSNDVLFTSSYGRNAISELYRTQLTPTDCGTATKVMNLPPMAEGICMMGDRVLVLYESASALYGDANHRMNYLTVFSKSDCLL